MTTLLRLTPRDHGRALSLEEFQCATAQEGYRYELIDGKLEVSPLPDLPHEGLRKWLERRLDSYAERHPEVINRVQAPARVFVPNRPKTTAVGSTRHRAVGVTATRTSTEAFAVSFVVNRRI